MTARLAGMVGRRHVLTGPRATRFYRTGFRAPAGEAALVACPGTLVELWQVLEYCVAQGAAIILQAANTGLTGGSTPAPGGYDRPVVIISVRRIKAIHRLSGARQVVCLPGTTLDELERFLEPLGREPHSVIGSTCFGASVIGGVCNNSGGSLVQRGPAYTRHALFARIDTDGTLKLVNHLGLDLGEDPIAILQRLDRGELPRTAPPETAPEPANAPNYAEIVRDIHADTPARYNANPHYLHEASGSAGKLAVFAVRLDTFERAAATRTFYIGSHAPDRLADLRRRILGDSRVLPIAAEYLHAEAFDLADRYGKDQFVLIDRLGTRRLPRVLAIKSRIDALLGPGLLDRMLYRAARILPDHLPRRMREWRARFDHHLLVKVAAEHAPAMAALLDDWLSGGDALFECTPREAGHAFLHRFVIAGAAERYKAVHARRSGGVLSLDIALRRNDRDWFETLPPPIAEMVLHRIYYGHFLCHVLHQDYVLAPGADAAAVKTAMLDLLDRRGARYPAEHNVGHAYHAAPELAAFYQALDPSNTFNPGVGRMSRNRDYA
jgi:D-lactate dehydrogenase (quinone)